MRFCGISEYFHNAGIAFIDLEGNVEFATESERYSKYKNDPILHKYLADMVRPNDHITFYESTKLRNQRTVELGYTAFPQPSRRYIFDRSLLHHESHAAAAFYTRPWESTDDTVILTIDGFGEYQSMTISTSTFELKYEEVYPQSVGSIYALITTALGYKSLEEEYIVMGMSKFGQPTYYEKLCDGISDMLEMATAPDNTEQGHSYDFARKRFVAAVRQQCPIKEDLAASVQLWAENEILRLAKIARKYGSKLVYAGGVAQNIVANSRLFEVFDHVHIAAHPADGGAGLGAAARSWAMHTGKTRLNWVDTYLGYDEQKTVLDPKEIAQYLNDHLYCGVVNGQAEFGPRALGNRSLLANPIYDIKDTVNKIKKRQRFRPFAPAILEEFADEYFSGPMNEYMQFTSMAKHDYSSVTHVDGSARVQLVKPNSRSILRPILEEFYEITGVPMLLNTSLNVRGKPIVNDRYDALLFETLNKTKVFV
jgi:carbamoyltransferase